MERERRSREYWEQKLSEYWDSGLTVQKYCKLKGGDKPAKQGSLENKGKNSPAI